MFLSVDKAFLVRHCLAMDILHHIKQNGMTVVGVAKAAEVSRATVYRVANGGCVDTDTAVAVARALGVTAVDLFPELGGAK